jgi:NitT/TauT family transport system substrate-binding protein
MDRFRRTTAAARRSLWVPVSVALALALGACAGGAGPAAKDSGGNAVLRVAQSTPAEWVQPVLAAQTGAFDRAHLTVKMNEFSSGRDALQALSGGAVDIAMATPSNVAPAVMSGEDLVVFGVVARWSSWRLVARGDRGITNPGSLVGKKIGVPTGTSADKSLGVLLASNGISRNQVTIVNVAPPDMNPALSNGSVDAVNIWQPNLSVLEADIPATVSIPYQMPNSFLLVTTRGFADSNAAVLRRFLDANSAVDGMLTGDKGQALDLMTGPARIKRPLLATIWKDFDFRTTGPSADIVGELADAARFVIDNKSQPGPAPDFTKHVRQVGAGA